MPVIINELELIVEDRADDETALTNEAPRPVGVRPIDIVRIIDREGERRVRLEAD